MSDYSVRNSKHYHSMAIFKKSLNNEHFSNQGDIFLKELWEQCLNTLCDPELL